MLQYFSLFNMNKHKFQFYHLEIEEIETFTI